MNWYKNNFDKWKEIIETVAREIKRDELMIEKDTIQSMFLFELSKSNLPFVFKGGTSLSKAFNIIDRFSEDIDLSTSRNLTYSEKRESSKIIIDIADSLGLILSNTNDVKSRYDYNKYVFRYSSLFVEKQMEIIIETSYYQTVYPIEIHSIECFVGHFCKERSIKLPISFDAAFFNMNVQTIERTFIDKVFAICDYRIQNMRDRDSRHLYDICKLIKYIDLNDELNVLIKKVRNDRMHSKNNPSAQLEYNIPNMLDEIIKSKFYEYDYKNITEKLLFENIDYDYAINNGIAIVAKSNLFN